MKLFTSLAAFLAAALLLPAAGIAAPAKPAGKMVTLYQADKCHMYFSAAQAKKLNYACPDSRGKMKKVTVSAAVAAAGLAKTTAALASQKPM